MQNLKDCLDRAIAYLEEDAGVERGGLITKDGTFIPFENQATDPRGLIEMGVEDFKVMTKLLREDNLYGWIHSHPNSHPTPSAIDVTRHDAPINMLIYSTKYKTLALYGNTYITELKKNLIDGTGWLEKKTCSK